MVSGETYTRYSPLDHSVVGTVKFTAPNEAGEVINRGREAFAEWSRTTIENRGRIVRKVAATLERRGDEFAALIRQETGKTLPAALGEISAASEMGYLVSSHGRHPSGYTLPSAIDQRHIRVERIPLGVALLIVTYNAPLPNYAWKSFPALMAGNSVILKPSPTTALSANLFAEVLWDCGVPQDAFQVIHGEGEIAAAIIEGGVDLVSFTGSYATGVKVVEATARTLAKTIIELGGSNPFIVCADADLDKAAEVAVDSAFSNAGQRCSSASRVIIEDSVYSSFRELFVEKANRLSFGMSPEVDVSTLINPESVAAFEGFLGNVEEAGGSILRLGTAVSEQREGGCVAQPALIEGLGIAHELASEEFFGPATRFFSFTTDDEAAAAANSTEYGLTAAVWSRDIPRAERIVRALEAGVISINGPTHGAEINMPFGGVKNSGNGSRDAGVYSIDQYSDIRVVSTFFGA